MSASSKGRQAIGTHPVLFVTVEVIHVQLPHETLKLSGRREVERYWLNAALLGGSGVRCCAYRLWAAAGQRELGHL